MLASTPVISPRIAHTTLNSKFFAVSTAISQLGPMGFQLTLDEVLPRTLAITLITLRPPQP